MPVIEPLSRRKAAAALVGATYGVGAIEWLNSKPLTAADLRGKVVLVEFWTYTCINWQRMHPHVRAWADKYRDQGLVVIGAHTPEFSFEKDPAMRDKPVPFRVLIDGQPPGQAHGADIDEQGRGMLVEPGLYQLVRQPQPVTARLFDIEFLEPGAQAYAFTFS